MLCEVERRRWDAVPRMLRPFASHQAVDYTDDDDNNNRGYTCTNSNGQTCALVVTSTTVTTGYCPSSTLVLEALMTRTLPDDALSLSTLSMFAPMFQLNFQSTDLPPASTSSTGPAQTGTSSTGSAQAGTSGTPSPTSPPTTAPTVPAANDNSLSTGAIAGISLSAALVAISLAIFVAIVWRRRVRRRTQPEEQEDQHALGYMAEMDSASPMPKRQELAVQTYVYEIGSAEVHELPAQRWSQRPHN